MTDPATAIDHLSLLQQFLSAGGGSIIGGGGVAVIGLKLLASKLISQWEKIPETLESLDKRLSKLEMIAPAIEAFSSRLQTLETRLAVHDAVAVDSRSLKDDLSSQRREIIILQQQVQAAWRVIDPKPRASDP